MNKQQHAVPIDNRFLYYLKKQKSYSYFVINPLENNISVYNLPDSSKPASPVATKVHFESKGLTEKFKIFVSRHLGDCTKVTNMVKSDFYTINDLPMIVETYNNCFE